MEDQYFAEQGVSLTADAEERARDNPRETLGQARNQLFNNRVRKPNMRPTELSQAANQSRVRRRQERSRQRDKHRDDERTRRQYVLKATEYSGRFVLNDSARTRPSSWRRCDDVFDYIWRQEILLQDKTSKLSSQ